MARVAGYIPRCCGHPAQYEQSSTYSDNVLHNRMCLKVQLECGPMPNVMVALPNIGGALCSTLQSLADAHY